MGGMYNNDHWVLVHAITLLVKISLKGDIETMREHLAFNGIG